MIEVLIVALIVADVIMHRRARRKLRTDLQRIRRSEQAILARGQALIDFVHGDLDFEDFEQMWDQ